MPSVPRTSSQQSALAQAKVIRWAGFIVVVAVTVLVFAPVLRNGFVNWDDDRNFIDNPYFRGLSWSHLHWMFTTFHQGLYIPLTWLSFSLDYVVWGMDPVGFHLTNLLLHALNAGLFYVLALHLFAAGNYAEPHQKRTLIAVIAAFLFALHPLRVESVAWVTERRDVLSGAFLLISLISYIKAESRKAIYGTSMGCFLLAVLAKPSTVMLPAVFLILDWYPLNRCPRSNVGLASRRFAKLCIEKLPFLLIALPTAVVAVYGQHNAGAAAGLELYDIPQRLAIASYGVLFYLHKTLLPLELLPLYRMPSELHWFAERFVIAATLGIAISGILFNQRRVWPAAWAAWLSYLVLLSPTSGLFQSGSQLVADRYSYLSCMPWALLAGGGLLILFRSTANAQSARLKWGLTVTAVFFVCGVLGAVTVRQIRHWRDSEALWSYLLVHDPGSAFAENNLGEVLRREGRSSEAVGHFEKALSLAPSAEAHYNLALALRDNGQTTRAIDQFRQAIDMKSNYIDAYSNLASLYAAGGRVAEAVQTYERYINIDPRSPVPHNNLGALLFSQRAFKDAQHQFDLAVALDPSYADAQCNLGASLAVQENYAGAMLHFKTALKLNPGQPQARSYLAAAKQGLINQKYTKKGRL